MTKITQAILTEMRKLEAQGLPQWKIAKLVGCSRGSVLDYLRWTLLDVVKAAVRTGLTRQQRAED